MSVFSDLRAALVTDLTVLGVPVHPAWPATLAPPCVFITPPLTSAAYLGPGQSYGEYLVSFDLVILVAHSDAASALTAIETLIQAAVANTADWALAGVDPPAPTAVAEDGAEYLAAVVHLSKPVRL